MSKLLPTLFILFFSCICWIRQGALPLCSLQDFWRWRCFIWAMGEVWAVAGWDADLGFCPDTFLKNPGILEIKRKGQESYSDASECKRQRISVCWHQFAPCLTFRQLIADWQTSPDEPLRLKPRLAVEQFKEDHPYLPHCGGASTVATTKYPLWRGVVNGT